MILKTPFFKIKTLIKIIKNWPLFLIDRLGIINKIEYTTYAGTRILCRTRSTDLNEAA